jgi:acetyltransferase
MHAHLVKHEDIKKMADGFVYPVVIKGIAKDLIHKSEVNAVKLNIKNRLELMSAEMEILNSFEERGIKLEEFIIQPYIRPKHELLIGGFRDPSFGPMIMFGSGGKYVEVFGDTAIRSAYISREDIMEMIEETKAGRILMGVRGEKPADLNKLAGIISSAAQMMLNNKELDEFDFNPVIVSNDNNLFTVDVRIKWNTE